MDRRTLGNLGEDFAAEVLQAQGYTILERNYRCKSGEIDLIAAKDGVIHFVEVKTRRSTAFGHPAESVTWEKQAKLRRAAQAYIQSHYRREPRQSFQVVEILFNQIEDAF
jgi:putative endonuclease